MSALPEPENSLHKQAAKFVLDTEQSLAKVLFLALLSHSPTLDRFSSGMFILVGAVFALIVPNLSTIVDLTSPETAKWFMLLLLLGSLCGIAQKFLAVSIAFRVQIADEIETKFRENFAKAEVEERRILQAAEALRVPVATVIDLKRVVEMLISTYPKMLKERARAKARLGERNPLFVHQEASRFLWRQSIWFSAQFILLMTAFALLVLKTDIPPSSTSTQQKELRESPAGRASKASLVPSPSPLRDTLRPPL
jgi:hypothetical protein